MTQLDVGKSTKLECMGVECGLRAMEDFVLKILAKLPVYREKFHYFAFRVSPCGKENTLVFW